MDDLNTTVTHETSDAMVKPAPLAPEPAPTGAEFTQIWHNGQWLRIKSEDAHKFLAAASENPENHPFLADESADEDEALFDDESERYAAKLPVGKRMFYLRFWSKEVKKLQRESAVNIAQQMGITLEQYSDPEFKRSPQQAEIYEDCEAALTDAIVADVVMRHGPLKGSFEEAEPIDGERAVHLMPKTKATIAAFCVAHFRYLVGSDAFFRLSSGGDDAGRRLGEPGTRAA